MAILPIRRFPDPILRETCREARPQDPTLPQLVHDMLDTMYAAPGVGLAAPQVGVPIRLVVVDPFGSEGPRRPLVMLNPVIFHREGSTSFEEGCLSLPELNVSVDRAARVGVRFQDLDGKVFEAEAEELLAVVIQHELDHLEGRMIIDSASLLKREAYRRKVRRHSVDNA